jgi:hypothetical protein
MPIPKKDRVELVMFFDQYTATIKKPDKLGRLRKFAYIGNTGIAFDFVGYLRKLGHTVKCVDQTIEEDL